MIRLGASVALFKPMDLAIAAPYIRAAGFSGTTVSLNMLVEQFNTGMWKEEVQRLKSIADDNGLELMSAGTGDHDPERARYLFESAAALSVSVICTGPNGLTGDGVSYNKTIDELGAMAKIAGEYKIPLVCKAHEGGSVHTTPEALRMVKDINNPYFGADIDPFHVFLADESLTEAAKALVPYLKYAHVQDFTFDTQGKILKDSPVRPACGRGDVDIPGYLKVLVDRGYNGPLMVEMYSKEKELPAAVSVTAEAYGYLNACLKFLGNK